MSSFVVSDVPTDGPSIVRCQYIYNLSDGQVQVSFIYATGTLKGLFYSANITHVYSVKKLEKIFTGAICELLLSFKASLYVYRSFIPNKTTFIKYCLTWISKLSTSFEIHWVRQYLVNFTGLASIVNATVYKRKPIFTGLCHGKLS